MQVASYSIYDFSFCPNSLATFDEMKLSPATQLSYLGILTYHYENVFAFLL